jgi:hypothetical protein
LQEQTTHIIVLTPKALNFLNSCSHWDGLFWYLVDKFPWNCGPIDANSLTLRERGGICKLGGLRKAKLVRNSDALGKKPRAQLCRDTDARALPHR